MIKILPIAALILLTVGFVSWKVFFASQKAPILSLPQLTNGQKARLPDGQEATPSGTLEARVRELEFSVTDLLGKNKTSTTEFAGSLDSQVKTLQTSVDDLKKRVAKLEASPTPTTQTSSQSSKSPAYISLAATGGSSVGDWANISGTVVSIDTADYSGYTSMQFEANIQIFQTGTAYSRIGNKTDGTSILSSEISTTSTSYTFVTSNKFILPSGKKDYQLQLKSQITGYEASVQNARIKVNF